MSSYSAFTFCVLTIIKTWKMNHIFQSYFYYKSKCVVVSDHMCVWRGGLEGRTASAGGKRQKRLFALFIYLFIPSLSIFLFS